MNDLGLKQKAVVAVLVVLAFYALAVGSWFLHFDHAWKVAKKQYAETVKRFNREEKLISEKKRWDEAYEKAKTAMPMFDIGKATDTTWLTKVEDLAKANLVVISQIKGGVEENAGDVLELPIEVGSWEGSLEALVKFLHALENTDEGMFDVRELQFRPSNKKGYLKGSMVLTCAYMRKGKE